MDNIFGLSMTTIMIVVLVIMGICLLTVVGIAWRNRVVFKMAMRNPPRRKAQTVLIMLGLMLATLIIAASMTTGDTIAYSITKSTYDSLGQTDITIAFVGDSDDEGTISVTNQPIPTSIVDHLETELGDNPDIQGFMPLLTIDVAAFNQRTMLNEFSVTMTGVDLNRLAGFGGLSDVNGKAVETIPDGSGVLSESLAKSIDATVGDQVTYLFNNQPATITVSAIAPDSLLTGVNVGGDSADQHGIAVPLPWLQQVTGLDGMARFIAVSNTGGVEDGAKLTDAVTPELRSALNTLPDGTGAQLGINPIKQDAIDGAELFANVFMSLFIVLGLFSVAAGVLLIFLIFMMLAAERRAEMGMARAVGMKRSHLVQMFIAEGTAYDLGAALIGAVLGVLVAFAIAGIMGQLIGEFVSIHPHFTWRSLVVAYALGVSVTFLTIIFASVRTSRLNIAQAIRDLPEFKANQRSDRPRWRWWAKLPRFGPKVGIYLVSIIWFPLEAVWNVGFIWLRALIWGVRVLAHYIGWSPIVLVPAVLLMIQGQASTSAFFFYMGLSLVFLCVGMLLRRVMPDRLALSLTSAISLLLWLAPASWVEPIFGDLGGGFEMFFLSGIMMVTFATLLIMWNAEAIVWLMSLLGRISSRWLPAIKTAVAYPLAAKGRTGMTIAMFALVIFSLVTMTTINTNFSALFSTDEAAAGWDINVQSSPSNPVDDLVGSLQGTDVDTANIAAVGRISMVAYNNTQVRIAGDDEWKRYNLNAMDDAYMDNAVIPLEARAPGYATDADVWNALRNDPTLALVDSFIFDADGFGNDPDSLSFGDYDISHDQISAIPLQIQNQRNGETMEITVIGVIDSSVSTLFGLYMPEGSPDAGFLSVFPAPDFQSLFVKMNDTTTVSPETFAKEIEAGLTQQGIFVQAESINDQLEEQQSIQNGFMSIIQGFMGLGLFVGIAALGVISFRSVVERRQQIGMLRAIGYQRSMVSMSFLLESLVIAALGIFSGTVLALTLSYTLITSGEISDGADFSGFVIPWVTVIGFAVASLAAAALMTWVPARKAASVPIAEALRYE